jgi:fructoselysine-6-P-deglycase FrlB-like protein
MAGLSALVEDAKRSDLFTAPRLEADLAAFLEDQDERIRRLAARVAAGEFDQVYFVGSGGSWANMFSGQYLTDRYTSVPSEVLTSYELIWRGPARLGPRALVFLASYSGSTEDTLAALRHANKAGATTIALTRRRQSPMATEADEIIDYESTALYALPLAAVTTFALELGRLSAGANRSDAERALAQMPDLPQMLGNAYRSAEAASLEQARQYLSATAMTVLASGPLMGLGYKFALTVFMENIRVAGSFIESSEFRHGPVEALERSRLDVVVLLGTDESRSMTERSIAAVEAAGSRVLRFDAADYDGVHPQLAPFLLLVPLQWFTVHSALLRGITDLDDRVFMGHGALAAGPDATWP